VNAVRYWHVQTSLDPRMVALMCPWPGCGQLSPVLAEPSLVADLIGKNLNCRFCGLPSLVPSNVLEQAPC
jgi:hypothetical protein